MAKEPLPRPLWGALVLVHVLFGLTVLGAAGVLMTAASVDAVDGPLLGLLAYAALPGVAGLVLARWVWTGGAWVRWGLLAVQGWFAVGALRTLGEGGVRGLTQLVLPVVIIVLLLRRPVRGWFLLAPPDRAGRRLFRLARMIRWRTDGGQTATEYLGLVVVVVAIIGGLVVTGVGGQITGGLRSAVCELSGSSCPAPAPAADGDTSAGSGGAASGASGMGSGAGGQQPSGGGEDRGKGDVPAVEEKREDNGGGQEDGEERESCSGWALLSCGAEQVGGFFEGVAVDGVWGDITGTFDTVMHPLKSLEGIKKYGKSLGEQWSKDSEDAGSKWDKGDYFGAVRDWGRASGKIGGKVVDDMFVGDDVRDKWSRGDQGQALGTVAWNVGSLFIPGYGEAKLIGRLGKLGEGAKLGKAGELAAQASEAAAKARKAAGAGDIDGARKAADEAQKHADDVKQEAERAGTCTIALDGRVRHGGDADGDIGAVGHRHGVRATGTGITVLAAGAPSYVIVAAGGTCDGDDNAVEAARGAQQAALDARTDIVRKVIQDHRNKQITEKSERFQLEEKNLDQLLKRAKDDPDVARGEIGKKELADSLEELAVTLRTKNIDSQSRGSLGGTVLKATNRHQLAEALAEAKATRRAAESEAAEGTKVHAGVKNKKRANNAAAEEVFVKFGDGTEVGMGDISEADVMYKARDGSAHLVEVKNTANAATSADIAGQIERVGKWQKAQGDGLGRRARYELETTKGWEKIFDQFQPDKNGVQPDGTPASAMAKNGVPARIAGKDISPRQLNEMDRAWNRLSASEKQQAVQQGSMGNPRKAMAFLGVN